MNKNKFTHEGDLQGAIQSVISRSASAMIEVEAMQPGLKVIAFSEAIVEIDAIRPNGKKDKFQMQIRLVSDPAQFIGEGAVKQEVIFDDIFDVEN